MRLAVFTTRSFMPIAATTFARVCHKIGMAAIEQGVEYAPSS
jgi:hypothetical protein